MPAADADPPSISAATAPGSPPSDDPFSPGSNRNPPPSRVDDPRAPSEKCSSSGGRVTLQLETDDVHPPAAGWLEPLLERAIDLLMPGSSGASGASGASGGSITLALLNDHDMASLHAQYTGVPGTTDVLTFDHREPTDFTSGGLASGGLASGGLTSGGLASGGLASGGLDANTALDADIALGRDVAVREAALRGHDARTELLLYAVHGLLHLLGHDDHDPQSYETMHTAEDQLLQQLGLSPVFASILIPDPRSPIPASEGGAS